MMHAFCYISISCMYISHRKPPCPQVQQHNNTPPHTDTSLPARCCFTHARLTMLPLQVHSLSVRAKGKLLLENTQLTVTAGRRYGLVGPNGKGKSTLLRLIARRQIPVPEGLDVLLVEQVCFQLSRHATYAMLLHGSSQHSTLHVPVADDLAMHTNVTGV